MRLTGLSRFAILVAAGFALNAAVDSPSAVLARFATALSQGEAHDAMSAVDKTSPDYYRIESAVGALAAQTDILCAIEIVEDKTPTLDTDWYLTLKPRGEGGETVRRRTRVTVAMRQVAGKWRIVSISPLTVLNPITVR